MRHTGTVVLQTPRLVLRPFTVDDCHAMYQNWACDPQVTRWLRWSPHRDWVFTAELLNLWQQQAQTDPAFYNWAIRRKADGELLGSISLFPSPEKGAGNEWEAGYCLGRAFWHCGYAAEALYAVCAHWFGAVGGGPLHAAHAHENPASGRVMQKVGFVYQNDAVYHKYDGAAVPCRCYMLTENALRRPAVTGAAE